VKSQDERTQTNNLCLQGRSTGIRGIHNNNLRIDKHTCNTNLYN
jgi:hypothetical protein